MIERQMTSKSCGPAVLSRLLSLYGKSVSQWEIIQKYPLGNNGWTVKQLIEAATNWGIKLHPKPFYFNNEQKFNSPIILLINNHYILVEESRVNFYKIFDPISGIKNITSLSSYLNDDDCIIIYPLRDFDVTYDVNPSKEISLLKYFLPLYCNHKSLFIKIFIILIITGAMQFILPFISRAIVDKGIGMSSLKLVKILTCVNMCLIIGTIIGNFLQTYLSTYIANMVKNQMLDNYADKLLKISIPTFCQLKIGDIIQRVSDTERINAFITNGLFQFFISFILAIIYGVVLAYFNISIFSIYFVCVFIYFVWIIIFLKKRKDLDFNFWKIKSENNKLLINIHNTIADIKGFGFENNMRDRWKSNINMLFLQNIRFLHFSQIQDVGSKMILHSASLIIIYISCVSVFDGKLTLGSLFAILYILGALNIPLSQLGEALNQCQLTMISLQRLYLFNKMDDKANPSLPISPKYRELRLQNVSFRYPGSEWILKSLNLSFENGLKYGIIGKSGSGKSTLLKLIAGLYPVTLGDYLIGSANSKNIVPYQFQNYISFCLQESSIIEGSILENIVIDLENYDESRLLKCIEIASIRKEIEHLPQSYNSILNNTNINLSKGQIQRILIARAIYKNADIYLFDEITNCLENDMGELIIKKIDTFLNNKTRIYVSHKPTTIKNSNFIYYLKDGYVFDCGTFEELNRRSRI